MVLRTTLLIGVIATLSACANNTVIYNPHPQRMSLNDLNYYKIDCGHATEQKKFLETQLSYIPRSQLVSYERDIIQQLLVVIKSRCEVQETKFNGCVHVHEDMTSGSAVATVCNDRRALPPREAPVINHWDPLVDLK